MGMLQAGQSLVLHADTAVAAKFKEYIPFHVYKTPVASTFTYDSVVF